MVQLDIFDLSSKLCWPQPKIPIEKCVAYENERYAASVEYINPTDLFGRVSFYKRGKKKNKLKRKRDAVLCVPFA
jgi:hypothetical protein